MSPKRCKAILYWMLLSTLSRKRISQEHLSNTHVLLLQTIL
ncbi:hypothetical protein [Dokdonia sp.]